MVKDNLQSRLLRWYRRVARALPWRDSPTPYQAWVSEIMLQQTQVETVLRYYASFLERFPTIVALAEAPAEQVLKQWEGMGYYARCRNLHRAARHCVTAHGGRFPETLEEAMALPGVGRSTAGAILTFGCGQAHPILDGNVKRVLARLYAIEQEISRGPVQRQLWQLSSELLEAARDPFDHNQAMMELGATVCTPRQPDCGACPVRTDCGAAAAGSQHRIPVKTRRAPLPHHHVAVGVIRRRRLLLLVQRPVDGLLGGLWEFPGGRQRPDERLEQTVRRTIADELGLEVTVRERIVTVEHAFTHFRLTLHAYDCRCPGGRPRPRTRPACRWVAPEAVGELPLPRVSQKVLGAVLDR